MAYLDLNQHCTYEGDDDYTFSHTAGYCGKPQPWRCGCAFCSPGYEVRDVHDFRFELEMAMGEEFNLISNLTDEQFQTIYETAQKLWQSA